LVLTNETCRYYSPRAPRDAVCVRHAAARSLYTDCTAATGCARSRGSHPLLLPVERVLPSGGARAPGKREKRHVAFFAATFQRYETEAHAHCRKNIGRGLSAARRPHPSVHESSPVLHVNIGRDLMFSQWRQLGLSRAITRAPNPTQSVVLHHLSNKCISVMDLLSSTQITSWGTSVDTSGYLSPRNAHGEGGHHGYA